VSNSLRRGYALLKRFLAGTLVFLGVAVVGFTAFAWRSAIAPVATPSVASFAPERVAQGEVLAAAGFCATCHTVKGGKPFAGGYAMTTGFGTIYSSNITPDVKTGIGTWSLAAFSRALREGVADDGSHLYPVFPYDHFTKLTDADIAALYAYVMTRPAVEYEPPANLLPFPLNMRALQAGWKLLFFRSGPLEGQPAHDAAWNRGAYLAEGLSHCGACHTPRNSLGAEDHSRAYSGAMLDGRPVPALTKANFSPVPWSQDELFSYLRTGTSSFHGRAGGPMAAVVRDGLSKLPDTDIRALAVYFADVGDTAARTGEMQAAVKRAQNAEILDLSQHDESARLYLTACASCHYNGGASSASNRPNLATLADVNSPDPTNLIRIVVFGHRADMPAFGSGLSNADIARILAYLRATRTTSGPWTDLEAKVAQIRSQPRP